MNDQQPQLIDEGEAVARELAARLHKPVAALTRADAVAEVARLRDAAQTEAKHADALADFVADPDARAEAAAHALARRLGKHIDEIGRASCRERV